MSVGERMKAMNLKSPSSRGRVLAFTSFVVLLSAFAATAQADALAQPTNVIAREHHATGNRYYRVLEFEKAIEEYKAGALREDAPVFSWNLGQCYRKLGRFEDAIWHYERFLDRGKPTGEVEAAAKRFIAQMKAELHKKKTATPSPSAGSASPGQMPPASHQSVEKSGGTPFHSTPSASLRSTEQHRGMSFQRELAIGVGAVGVAATSLGVVLGLRAQTLEKDAFTICPMTVCDRADQATMQIDRGKTHALYANVSFGVAAGAIVGSAVLWFTSPEVRRRRIVIAPHLSPGSTAVAISVNY